MRGGGIGTAEVKALVARLQYDDGSAGELAAYVKQWLPIIEAVDEWAAAHDAVSLRWRPGPEMTRYESAIAYLRAVVSVARLRQDQSR